MGVASSPDGPTGILFYDVITPLIPRLFIADLAIAFFFCAGELSVSMPEVILASFPGPLQL